MKLKKIAKAAIAPMAIGAGKLLSGGGAPQMQFQELDAGTKALIDEKTRQANQSPDELAGLITQGASEAGEQFMQGVPDASASLAMPAGDLDNAITQRAREKYLDKMQGVKTEAKRGATKMSLEASARGLSANESLARSRMQQHSVKMKNLAAKKNARAQVMGSIMGLGGTAIGAIYGGTAGATAGNQIGQGVGQTMAG